MCYVSSVAPPSPPLPFHPACAWGLAGVDHLSELPCLLGSSCGDPQQEISKRKASKAEVFFLLLPCCGVPGGVLSPPPRSQSFPSSYLSLGLVTSLPGVRMQPHFYQSQHHLLWLAHFCKWSLLKILRTTQCECPIPLLLKLLTYTQREVLKLWCAHIRITWNVS